LKERSWSLEFNMTKVLVVVFMLLIVREVNSRSQRL
jgi:hypothetical protein